MKSRRNALFVFVALCVFASSTGAGLCAVDQMEEFHKFREKINAKESSGSTPGSHEKKCMQILERLVKVDKTEDPEALFYYAYFLNRFGHQSDSTQQLKLVTKLDKPGGYWSKLAIRTLSERDKHSHDGYIGVQLRQNKIESVMQGSPAERYKLAVGDAIVGVEHVGIASLSSNELADKIRGPVGSFVSLEIDRHGKRYLVKIPRASTTVEHRTIYKFNY